MPGAMQQRGRDNRAEAQKSMGGHEDGGGAPAGGDGHVVTIHHDGQQYHAQHADGETTQHEHLHGAMAEAGSKHMGGMHHMTHHDGMGGGMTTHHAQHGEPAEGPHDHENLESVKQGMDQFFNEEQQEGHHDGGEGVERAGEDEY